jgi:GMP reductase
MADGGCTNAGDIAKAFGGGADFVMLGGMLAGHTECEGQEEEIDGTKYKTFYGMSSKDAMEKHNGGVAKYRSAEGKTIRVKHRGLVQNTLESILGGLRSACTYIGARRLKDMPKCATFVRVTQQSNEVYGRNV